MKKTCNIFLLIAFIASIASVIYFGIYALIFQRAQKVDPATTENVMIGLLWVFAVLSIPSIVFSSKTRKKLANAFSKKELLITSILLLVVGVLFAIVSILSYMHAVVPYTTFVLVIGYLGSGVTMLLLKDEDLY